VKSILKLSAVMTLALCALLAADATAKGYKRYGHRFCDHPDYECVTVGSHTIEKEVQTKKGVVIKKKKVRDTWENLWPDPREREIVKKVNRMRIRLRKRMKIAVPLDMDGKTFMDYSPFPPKMDLDGNAIAITMEEKLAELRARGFTYHPDLAYQCHPDPEEEAWQWPDLQCFEADEMLERVALLEAPEEKPASKRLLIYDPKLLAFGAYEDQKLVRWGPGVGGKGWCGDVKRSCRTRTGVTRVRSKRGRYARSSKYPLDCEGSGCAAVPYYISFFPSYGFHASSNVPGRHASHGCIRLFFDDAKWLNLEFAKIGTKVTVRPYE